VTTIERFIFDQEHRYPEATGELSNLLYDIALASKIIAAAIRRAGLVNILGTANARTVQGEEQQKLDVIANETIKNCLNHTGRVCVMGSEEDEDIIPVPPEYPVGKYAILFDPLDGSSNIDVNISVGTIFSVLKCPKLDGGGYCEPDEKAFLQPGRNQVAAGFAVYGPTTVFVLTVGDGTHGFTLDRETYTFVLTHPDIRIPPDTQEFAINVSNQRRWEPPVRRYIDECLAGKDGPRGKDFNMRWVASMVADVFRVLSRGGIFMYPRDSKNREGRLRLMYEANPMAFIVEQAGGAATDGRTPILDLQPKGLHQRVAVVLGSRNEVSQVASYHGA
jgi:fructose-1,6-bisphosphatase I